MSYDGISTVDLPDGWEVQTAAWEEVVAQPTDQGDPQVTVTVRARTSRAGMIGGRTDNVITVRAGREEIGQFGSFEYKGDALMTARSLMKMIQGLRAKFE